jgi:hypothetical protein
MAQLIPTGKHEAIDLKTLHTYEIKRLDEEATNVVDRNGGYAKFIMRMWRGVFTLLEIKNQTHVLNKKDNPCA